MDTSIVTLLIQGGAIGISLGLMFIIWKAQERNNHTSQRMLDAIIQLLDYLEKNTRALIQLESIINKSEERSCELSRVVEKLCDKMDKVKN